MGVSASAMAAHPRTGWNEPMMILAVLAATLTILCAALFTGVCFGFSVSVMPGLDAVAPEQAVRSMQSMNDKILNPLFLSAFMLVPVVAAVTGVLLLLMGHRAAGFAFFAAAAVYLLGSFVPTVAVSVPMNDTLAALGTPDGAQQAAQAWADYAPRWTRWNSLRTAFSGVSLLVAGLGVYLWGRSSAS
jgi:uncharacterized membrane protein